MKITTIRTGARVTVSLGLLLLVFACSPPAAQEEQDAGLRASSVEVVTLTSTSFDDVIELVGTTEPIRAANIASEVGGRITMFDIVEGQVVEAGQLILRVDASQQGAQAAQLRAQIDQLDSDIDRTERLLERGMASQQQLDQLRSQREATYQNMRSVRIGVGNARTNAPFTGVVASKHAEAGEFASPGATLARIVDISTVKVIVHLPEREVGSVRTGMLARVEIPATGQITEGEIVRIGSEADTRSRTFPVEIRIPNEDGSLRAGMRTRVHILKERLDDVVVVPRDAVVQGITGPEAVVVRDDHAHIVELEPGPARGRFMVVRSGLSAGDQLVVRGQRNLVENEPVVVVDGGSCCASQMNATVAATLPPVDTAAPPSTEN